MSELRKAAQMALEALEIASRNGADGLKRYELRELDDTIAFLRAALAQPEQDLQLVANFLQEYGLEALEVIAALKTQPDPVEVRQGWKYMREKGLLQETWNEHPIDTDTTCGPMLMTVGDTLARAGFIKKPKPLTEEQIYEILGYGAMAQYNSVPQYAIECVRAVEKAHGIS